MIYAICLFSFDDFVIEENETCIYPSSITGEILNIYISEFFVKEHGFFTNIYSDLKMYFFTAYKMP